MVKKLIEKFQLWYNKKIALGLNRAPVIGDIVFTVDGLDKSRSLELLTFFLVSYDTSGKRTHDLGDIINKQPDFDMGYLTPSAVFQKGRLEIKAEKFLSRIASNVEIVEVFLARKDNECFGMSDFRLSIKKNAVTERLDVSDKYPYNEVLKVGHLLISRTKERKLLFFKMDQVPFPGDLSDFIRLESLKEESNDY